MSKTFIIGVCGKSCSGKDSVIQRIASVNRHVLHISMDMFFKNKTNCLYNGCECWEHTDVIQFDHLFEVVSLLKGGYSVTIKDRSLWYGSYDCEIVHHDLYESRIVILQGYLLFTDKKLIDLFDNKIFIDVSDKEILKRRLAREDNADSKEYIQKVIIPVSKEYAYQRRTADKIVDSNRVKTDDIADELVNYINCQLDIKRRVGLLVSPRQHNVWTVSPGDLLSDHEWHPIDFNNLKSWVKQYMGSMHSGKTLYGNTFEYRRNPKNSGYEVRLRKEQKHYRHIFRYNMEPTKPRKPV